MRGKAGHFCDWMYNAKAVSTPSAAVSLDAAESLSIMLNGVRYLLYIRLA